MHTEPLRLRPPSPTLLLQATFLFSSILVILSALIFESGNMTLARRNPIQNSFTSSSGSGVLSNKTQVDDDITDSEYVMVVFVIGIVVLSTVYFATVLLLELFRSCIFCRRVIKARDSLGPAGTKQRDERRTRSPSEAKLSDMVVQERTASTGSFTGSNPHNSRMARCLSISEDQEQHSDNDDECDEPSAIGKERLGALSSFFSSGGGGGAEAPGTRNAGGAERKTNVQRRAKRFGGEKTRKKNFDLEPSMVGHEQDDEKGSDDEPSMVQTHDTFHINPDSKLGNALRVLKKTTSAVVDDEPGRSADAAAQRLSLHRTPSGRLSSMYGDDSDIL